MAVSIEEHLCITLLEVSEKAHSKQVEEGAPVFQKASEKVPRDARVGLGEKRPVPFINSTDCTEQDLKLSCMSLAYSKQ